MKINNLSAHYATHKYITARYNDGAWWFYDAWDDYDDACEQAAEIDGEVFLASKVERGL